MLAYDGHGARRSNVVERIPIFQLRADIEVFFDNLLPPRQSIAPTHGWIIADQRLRRRQALTRQPMGSKLGPGPCFAMKWILFLPPTIAAALLLWGAGTIVYVLFLWQPAAASRPLRLSQDVTHICVGFTASYCDETIGPAASFPPEGPWKTCGMDIILSPPKVPILLMTPETVPCPDHHRDVPEVLPLSAPASQSHSGGRVDELNSPR